MKKLGKKHSKQRKTTIHKSGLDAEILMIT